jgi:hypothetical protein
MPKPSPKLPKYIFFFFGHLSLYTVGILGKDNVKMLSTPIYKDSYGRDSGLGK